MVRLLTSEQTSRYLGLWKMWCHLWLSYQSTQRILLRPEINQQSGSRGGVYCFLRTSTGTTSGVSETTWIETQNVSILTKYREYFIPMEGAKGFVFLCSKKKKKKKNLLYFFLKWLRDICFIPGHLHWGIPSFKKWVGPGARVSNRAVASLTVPDGQEFHFPHFSSNFDEFFSFFLKLYLFSSSFWPSRWASRPPGKALATPLECNPQALLALLPAPVRGGGHFFFLQIGRGKTAIRGNWGSSKVIIPEKYVLFVSPWTSLIPPLAIRVPPPAVISIISSLCMRIHCKNKC